MLSSNQNHVAKAWAAVWVVLVATKRYAKVFERPRNAALLIVLVAVFASVLITKGTQGLIGASFASLKEQLKIDLTKIQVDTLFQLNDGRKVEFQCWHPDAPPNKVPDPEYLDDRSKFANPTSVS